jgi:pSer/pThr/pTyr-binding forkhead associated (FHA) protein
MGFLVVTFSKTEEEYAYHRLKKGVNFLGRFGARSEVELRDPEVSQQHALFICNNLVTRIVDLDSSNGVEINGQKSDIAVLQEGDIIRVGRTELMYVPFHWEVEE